MEDYHLTYDAEHWCKENGFEVVSCEGDGCNGGYTRNKHIYVRGIMMKIAIWGTGEIFKKNFIKVCKDEVICLVDRNPKDEEYFGIKVINPEELYQYSYDFIVIFSTKYFEEIAYKLIMEMGIECKKILAWEYFLEFQFMNNGTMTDVLREYCCQKHIMSICDIGGVIGEQQINISDKKIAIDVYLNNTVFDLEKNREDSNTKKYDMVIVSESNISSDNLYNLLQRADNVFIILPFHSIRKMRLKKESDCFIVNWHGFLYGHIQKKVCSSKIFEITHKNFMPIREECYLPIMAGNCTKKTSQYIGDDSGDNISFYNNQINELTALYWIWKHAQEQIIGLNHYRRFFESPFNRYCMLQYGEIQLLMENYDIIVAKPVFLCGDTVLEHLQTQLCEEAYQQTYTVFTEIINGMDEKEKAFFEEVFSGHMLYPCNMFVTTKEILSEYCEWLFPIVFKLLDRVVIKEEWDNYSKRVIGFFAERFLTVWLLQQKYSIKELPILLIGNEGPYGK